MNKMNDAEFENKLREFFEANYEYLKETSGHSINQAMKEQALEQVFLYWKKHKDMILGGEISSVKLSAGNLRTPNQNIPFALEGEINTSEKDGQITLFDITTKSREQIENDIDFYQDELNLFAYEAEKMSLETSGKAFALSTSIPKDIRYAIKTGDTESLQEALQNWNPLVPIECSKDAQEATLSKIGEVVEKIHNCEFDPPPVSELKKKYKDGKSFCSHVCENCDIRKSCESYITYSGK